jgi:hypothetical protein
VNGNRSIVTLTNETGQTTRTFSTTPRAVPAYGFCPIEVIDEKSRCFQTTARFTEQSPNKANTLERTITGRTGEFKTKNHTCRVFPRPLHDG